MRGIMAAVLLAAAASVLQSCGWFEDDRKQCARYQWQSIQIPYCAKMGNGYCEQTGYRYASGNVCVESVCKPEYIAHNGKCLTQEEYAQASRSR
jgi:hypothetical protein